MVNQSRGSGRTLDVERNQPLRGGAHQMLSNRLTNHDTGKAIDPAINAQIPKPNARSRNTGSTASPPPNKAYQPTNRNIIATRVPPIRITS